MKEGVIYHDEDSQKFFIKIEDQESLINYRKNGEILELYYTFVPEAFRDQGIASKLVETALEYAKDKNYKVKPTCPFVASYIKEHDEYLDLVE